MDMQFLPFCKEHAFVVPNHQKQKQNSLVKYHKEAYLKKINEEYKKNKTWNMLSYVLLDILPPEKKTKSQSLYLENVSTR